MVKWYEDPELIALADAADKAFDSCNLDALLKVATKCEDIAKTNDSQPMVKARLLYCTFTAISDAIALLPTKCSENKNYNVDELSERAVFYARTALKIYENYLSSNHVSSEEEQVQTFYSYCQLAINYSKLMRDYGRVLEGISILQNPLIMGTPLVNGCLGTQMLQLARLCYDKGHRIWLLYKAYKYLDFSIKNKNTTYNAEQLMSFEQSKKYIENCFVNREFISSDITIQDFLDPFENMSENETLYREWIAKHTLALNILNDCEKCIEIGYDPLFLPSMLGDLETQKPPVIQSLFNQIKQEYVSARFLVYEGMTTHEQHYSDKEVFLINTLDYPIYCLGIEKIKFGFRACYSILDSIAFLMNEYFDLKIKQHSVSYHAVWSAISKVKKENKDCIFNTNEALLGMFWLFKDIRSYYSNEYKDISAKFKKINDIRNALEHRSLKVIRFEMNGENTDNVSYKVSYDEFQYLTLELFKYIRENIITLLFAISINEAQKREAGIYAPIISFEYSNDDKLLF